LYKLFFVASFAAPNDGTTPPPPVALPPIPATSPKYIQPWPPTVLGRLLVCIGTSPFFNCVGWCPLKQEANQLWLRQTPTACTLHGILESGGAMNRWCRADLPVWSAREKPPSRIRRGSGSFWLVDVVCLRLYYCAVASSSFSYLSSHLTCRTNNNSQIKMADFYTAYLKKCHQKSPKFQHLRFEDPSYVFTFKL
jgi:hypothetical protein